MPFLSIARFLTSLSLVAAYALLVACSPADRAVESTPAGASETVPDAPGSGSTTPPDLTGGEIPAVALPAPNPLLRDRRPRGLWVLAEGSERVLDDPSKIPVLVEQAQALGATDLFVQVYRGGRAWYDATLADATPYREVMDATGVDPLAELLRQAHSAGLHVHAWVNVLSLSLNTQAPILTELGRDAVLVDRNGRSVLDYPNLELPQPDSDWYRMGTRGVYLDPGAPGVNERLAATFRELVERYPDLDGLHLDYIRHPGALPFVPGSRFGVGIDFGYGAQTQARFRAETGLSGPYRNPEQPDPAQLVNANQWDDWRRQKVTDLVALIRSQVHTVKPTLVISAAVNSYVDRAYLSLAQDWNRWLEEGLLDLAIPMTYTLDDRLLRYQLETFANGQRSERIWPGVGTWLHARRPAQAIEQIETGRRAGTFGEVLFSYDSIAAAPQLYDALVAAERETEKP